MIYDPSGRAQELRHRILETMTAEELKQYAKQLAERERMLRPTSSVNCDAFNALTR